MKMDLHMHSTCSDGTCTPMELLKLTKEYAIVSITDHDSVDAYDGLDSSIRPMRIIPGIELSTYFPFEIHILGYFLDVQSIELRTELNGINKTRYRNTLKTADRLYQAGRIQHPIPQLLQKYRPFTLDHLIQEIQLTDNSIQKADCFQDKTLLKGTYIGLTPEKGIALIQKYKGISFLAHPKKTVQKTGNSLSDLIRILKGYGLQGIECYHESHAEEDVVNYLATASKFQLIISGGSDFHGLKKPDSQLGIGGRDISIPDVVIRGWIRLYDNYYAEKEGK